MSLKISTLSVLWVCVSINFVPAQSFDAEKDVIFRLFTRKNMGENEGQIIRLSSQADLLKSNFNFNSNTRILIHGWNGGDRQSTASVASAYLQSYDVNIISVDYQTGRAQQYAIARANVGNVGEAVAQFIDWLNSNGVAFSSINLIGNDLGAHVAGMAGKRVTRGKIARIEGLDPSALLFDIKKPAERLDRKDADYVEVIHTFISPLVGFVQPIGTADFYANYGTHQPGCTKDILGSCSHARAIAYFAESLAPNRAFVAQKCRGGFNDIIKRNCVPSGVTAIMGGERNDHPASGVYYLQTNRAFPYSQGP